MATAKANNRPTLKQTLPYILAICGAIGLACAAIITYDKFKILENPHYIPSCDLNPIIACGSVMQSKQGQAFGFPNPIIGLAAYPIVMTIGVGMLAGARFKRWFWLGLNAGTVFGIAFIHWLFFESVYRIHALCPWCMVVWVVTITTFWYVTLYNIDEGYIKLPKGKGSVYAWIRRHHLDILILWLLIILVLILKHFWYYYGRHF